MGNPGWNAAAYHRSSDVQEAWADQILDRLPLRGDETVLDAGCGSGRVTQRLLDRLPGGRVVAVDASADMVAHARAALDPARVTVLHQDLARLELDAPVDAAFSNAVFHWVPDQDGLFNRLRAALRPGAPLAAGCGAEGNVEGFIAMLDEVAARPPFAEHLAAFQRPWRFLGVEETETRLRAAGFAEVRVWAEPTPVTPGDPDAFLRAAPLCSHLQLLPEDLHDAFVAAVRERCGEPLRMDFVRLQIAATA